MTLRSLFCGVLILGTFACDRLRPGEREVRLPPVDSVEAVFRQGGVGARVAFDGTVLELLAHQDPDHLRRGGSLWARVGPYIYLFTPATQRVFETWADISAVRVVTVTPDGKEVARAQLRRGALSDVQWRRSLNLLGHALQEGTARPRRLEELVRWGETHTDYRYDPQYAPR